jgi:uncharacterized protein YecE (DUF72 family)
MPVQVYIGTAGWSIPRAVADAFPAEGSGLQRYASRFHFVEINTTFYRPHRPQTFARWATSVADDFRFAVKIPKAFTHELQVRDAEAPLRAFFEQTQCLGDKHGPYLVQLPPSLAYDEAVASAFFTCVHSRSHASSPIPRVCRVPPTGRRSFAGLLPPARIAANVCLVLR